MSPEIISGKDTSEQTEKFLKEYNNIDGTRLPGSRRHENRANKGPREVNTSLVNTIINLRDES
jgi:delta1-piperideine-2-carboxylate reductase